MRVALVTTWDTACGIAEYAWYWKQAVTQAAPELEITVVDMLHPRAIEDLRQKPDWVWLNYHAALHSQWQPEDVTQLQVEGIRVGITYHDTGVPNSDQCRNLHQVADAFVVHEPCEDLPGAVLIRQGVPGWASPTLYDQSVPYPGSPYQSWCGPRPIVGAVGFPFPWKNYDLLAEASARAGWALLLIAPNATLDQQIRWHELNPYCWVRPEFLDRREVLSLLTGCDATAFLYACANTGTSGAIRQGIAARKPVLASGTNICRQFRDLGLDPVGQDAITWLQDLTVEGVARALSQVPLGRVHPPMVRLAEQDGWAGVGRRYAALYREVAR